MGMGRASDDPARPRKGAGRRLPRILLVYAVVLLVMLGALYVVGRAADRARSTEASLMSVEGSLYRLDSASLEEWSDVQVRDAENLSDIQGELIAMERTFNSLIANDPDGTVSAIQPAFETYRTNLQHTLDVTYSGDREAAIGAFERQADPALGAVLEQVQAAAVRFRAAAGEADRGKDEGVLVVLVLGVSIMALVTASLNRKSLRLVSTQAQADALEKSERRFTSLMAGSADLVTILDRDGIVHFQSHSIEGMLGWTPDQFMGHDLREYLHPEDAKALSDVLTLAERSTEHESVEWRFVTPNGSLVHTEAILLARFDDPYVNGFLVSIRNLSERLVLEEALRHQAFHDPLTRLANRTLFEDRLAHAYDRTARTGRSLCVLLIDLDEFKDINDSFGHASGDRVLVEVAERLLTVVRQEDTVARLGGDEFAILIDEGDDDEGLLLAERLLDAFDAPLDLDGTELFVHASIGIATGSATGGHAEEHAHGRLMVDADLAMYEAKRQGRNQFRFYAPGMQEGVHDRLRMRSDLERGLINGEFVVHYQPIFSIDSEAIVGAEALVRWNHPEQGMVPPLQFIPIAEQTGLILELGRFVLREACREAAGWGDDTAPYVSVNVAGSQLHQPQFVTEVRHALSDAGLPPHRLVVEMTESALIEDADDSVRRLEELHELGVGLAIDDFGTGYSSLSYLRRFNMDVLKIDKFFVDELGQDERRSELVAAMVGMGTSLGMKVVAEGIEDRAQLEDLRGLNCDMGQGYLVSKPVPAEQLREQLTGSVVGAAPLG
jgi:diguanylate cyclase (GGDEF)-like protein/PAS domain S-box-containing protein